MRTRPSSQTTGAGRFRRRAIVQLGLAAAIVLLASPGRSPHAQAVPAPYTFTLIAEHGFPQVVEGQGEMPQFVAASRHAINDAGLVAFGHAAAFPFNRTVVSVGDGTAIRQVHGGGFAAPNIGVVGIDGQGRVYVFAGPSDPLCPPTTSNCIVRIGANGSDVIASASSTLLPRDFLANGAHPRLQSGPSRLAYYADTPTGAAYHTEAGLVAAAGAAFPGLVSRDYDLNASGEVVFLAQTTNGFGIFAARAGDTARTVFLNGSNPSGISFSSIQAPRIDDSGRVFFIARRLGDVESNVFRIDPGSQDPLLLIDGNDGSVAPLNAISFAVNGSGGLALLARTPGGTLGIFTGPDPAADKVVEVGDLLGGRPVLELRLGERSINNNGVAGRGQIVFAARLDANGNGLIDSNEGYDLYRANPPGSTPDNPVLPLVKAPGATTYGFARVKKAAGGATVCYWDPPVAVGYEYSVAPGDAPFEAVTPPSFPTHDTYELQLWNGGAWAAAGSLTGRIEHVFPPGGVDRFRITGIPASLGLDVDDPVAFVTGLRFVDAGPTDTVELSMTVLTEQQPPTIAWPAPAPIVYGTPLGSTQLNATTAVPGSFSYSPAAGVVLRAGTHTLAAVFTPDDPTAPVATASALLQVLPAPLTIRAEDKSMVAGDPLPPLTAVYAGFVNGDGPASLDIPPALSTTADGSTVGTFSIAVSGASDPDYAMTVVNGTLTVRPRQTTCLGEPDRTALIPINADGTSVFKKGSSVIVRFRACDAAGRSIAAPDLVAGFTRVSSHPGTAVNHVNELPLYLPPTSRFHWDPFLRQWVFILSTHQLGAPQTHAYRIGLKDGATIDFRFGVR